MTKLNEVYKCDLCGNILEVLHQGADLVCCGAPMKLLVENTVDASKEKHVPVIEVAGDVVTVTVGGVHHPMEEAHLIEWIELIADGKVYRQALKAGDAPVATFNVKASSLKAREYCNLHGLWSAQK